MHYKPMSLSDISTLDITLVTNILTLFSSYSGAVDVNTLCFNLTKVIMS